MRFRKGVLLVLAASVVAASGASGSPAGAAMYFGEKPGVWKARILVRDNEIKAVRIVVPSTCRSQGTSSESKLTWNTGWGPNESLRLRIKKHGNFYRETYTDWSRQIVKGRVIGDRIQGLLWFSDEGDYVRCWTGTGKIPNWTGFHARKVEPRRG